MDIIQKWSLRLLLIAAIIWGGSYSVLKHLLDIGVGSFYLIGIRFLGGSLFLAIIFKRNLSGLTGKDWKAGLITGTFLCLTYSAQSLGLLYTTPSKSAIIISSYIVVVPFLERAVYKTPIKGRTFISCFLVLCGMATFNLDLKAIGMNKGDFISLGSALSLALHTIFLDYYSKRIQTVKLSIVQLCCGGVVAMGISCFVRESRIGFSGTSLLALMYLVVLATATGYTLQTMAQKYVPPTKVSLILSTQAIFGIVFSVLFYKEGLNIRVVTGVLLILLALGIQNYKAFSMKGKVNSSKI